MIFAMIYPTLLNLDYSHPYVTDRSHILTIHHFASHYYGGLALELGSYQGHSTLALAMAGLSVVSYDLDTTCLVQRKHLLSAFKVEWRTLHSSQSLHERRKFDVVFHDAEHGNAIVPELEALWLKITNQGILIVHDSEQITIPLSFNNVIYNTKDVLGRQLTIYQKN